MSTTLTEKEIAEALRRIPNADFPRPFLVVPDDRVEAFREAFGDRADIYAVSETLVPSGNS